MCGCTVVQMEGTARGSSAAGQPEHSAGTRSDAACSMPCIRLQGTLRMNNLPIERLACSESEGEVDNTDWTTNRSARTGRRELALSSRMSSVTTVTPVAGQHACAVDKLDFGDGARAPREFYGSLACLAASDAFGDFGPGVRSCVSVY